MDGLNEISNFTKGLLNAVSFHFPQSADRYYMAGYFFVIIPTTVFSALCLHKLWKKAFYQYKPEPAMQIPKESPELKEIYQAFDQLIGKFEDQLAEYQEWRQDQITLDEEFQKAVDQVIREKKQVLEELKAYGVPYPPLEKMSSLSSKCMVSWILSSTCFLKYCVDKGTDPKYQNAKEIFWFHYIDYIDDLNHRISMFYLKKLNYTEETSRIGINSKSAPWIWSCWRRENADS